MNPVTAHCDRYLNSLRKQPDPLTILDMRLAWLDGYVTALRDLHFQKQTPGVSPYVR